MARVSIPERWLLFIYTVPALPTSKRAWIWREIKRAGAMYLRDGVCVLPPSAVTLATFRMLVSKVREFKGDAILAENCELPPERAVSLVDEMIGARTREYGELIHEATLLMQHFDREREHRAIGRVEFESDIEKLHRWYDQIRARDYFGAPQAAPTREILVHCSERLSRLGSAPYEGEPE
jgi:hypothetical protein